MFLEIKIFKNNICGYGDGKYVTYNKLNIISIIFGY